VHAAERRALELADKLAVAERHLAEEQRARRAEAEAAAEASKRMQGAATAEVCDTAALRNACAAHSLPLLTWYAAGCAHA
jgi:hypothetical protein